MALPDKLTDNLNELSSLWLAAKEAEKEATEDRRKIEDRIRSLVGFAENSEGTETVDPDQFTIKIVGRIDRKVDGLTEHLASLFRWKPEINMAVWKATDEAITKPLAAAITAKPGRPSFTITRKEK
jgi:hypothetical protein